MVYHSLLSDEMDVRIERVQSQALKIIYGFDNSARRVLELSGLDYLSTRRKAALEKFAVKAEGGKFQHWFPKRDTERNLRRGKIYVEEMARCDRLKNTPVFAMRRKLNELYSQV